MSRNYSSTAVDTTLTSGVSSANTTLAVASTTGFPAAPFVLAVDAGAAAQELVLVTAVGGLSLTVTRGYDSTVAATHEAGAVISHSHAAIDFREAGTHIDATAAHGATGAVVGTTNVQTLTNKTLTAPAATGSLSAFGGAWTAYAPAIAGGGAHGNATATGGYEQVGKSVRFWARIVLGATSTVTGPLEISLPTAAEGQFNQAGMEASLTDTGTANYVAVCDLNAAGTRARIWLLGAGGLYTVTSGTAPFTWTTGDIIEVRGTYEAA